MFRSKMPKVSLSIPVKTLEAIFDECDRDDVNETGGRIIGTYNKKGKHYEIDVLGIIDAGPKARRSPTSLFQDGEYQETVFRHVEKQYRDIEHLGSWHTHHVNGLSTLSSGDRATYQKTVNHSKHNTDFFYALLVTRKTPGGTRRYDVRHYIVLRNDDSIHEIPESDVEFLDESRVRPFWSTTVSSQPSEGQHDGGRPPNPQRVKDQSFFSDFYPSFKPGLSKTLGVLYWKGSVPLVDGSHAEVLAMESSEDGEPRYSVRLTTENLRSSGIANDYKDRSFPSARHAVLQLERDLNAEVYRAVKECRV